MSSSVGRKDSGETGKVRPCRSRTTLRQRRGRALLAYQVQLAMSQRVEASILRAGMLPVTLKEGYFSRFGD